MLIDIVASNLSAPSSWLDIGCGVGVLLACARKQGFEIAGIEPDPLARTWAIERLQTHSIYETLESVVPAFAKLGVVSMLDVPLLDTAFGQIHVRDLTSIPTATILSRLALDSTIPSWKAYLSLPGVALINEVDRIRRKTDSLVILFQKC